VRQSGTTSGGLLVRASGVQLVSVDSKVSWHKFPCILRPEGDDGFDGKVLYVKGIPGRGSTSRWLERFRPSKQQRAVTLEDIRC